MVSSAVLYRHKPPLNTGPRGPREVRKMAFLSGGKHMPLHFTDALVANLQCPAGQKDKLFFDQTQKGLAVRVTLAGARIFLIQWTDGATKQKRREVLGVFGAITTGQVSSPLFMYQ